MIVPLRLTSHVTRAYGAACDRFPGDGDEKGTGFETPAAPATVSGEPSGHMPLGPQVLRRRPGQGADPQARRPARRGRPSSGQGAPNGRVKTRATTCPDRVSRVASACPQDIGSTLGSRPPLSGGRS